MDTLLKKIAEESSVNIEDVSRIIELEKKNVYKKKRSIIGDLRQIIDERANKMEEES